MQRITPFKVPILEKAQTIPDLGKQMNEIRSEALQSFDKNASRYHQGVYEKKRKDMLDKLNTQLHVLFVGQLKNLHKRAITMFEENLKVKARGELG